MGHLFQFAMWNNQRVTRGPLSITSDTVLMVAEGDLCIHIWWGREATGLKPQRSTWMSILGCQWLIASQCLSSIPLVAESYIYRHNENIKIYQVYQVQIIETRGHRFQGLAQACHSNLYFNYWLMLNTSTPQDLQPQGRLNSVALLDPLQSGHAKGGMLQVMINWISGYPSRQRNPFGPVSDLSITNKTMFFAGPWGLKFWQPFRRTHGNSSRNAIHVLVFYRVEHRSFYHFRKQPSCKRGCPQFPRGKTFQPSQKSHFSDRLFIWLVVSIPEICLSIGDHHPVSIVSWKYSMFETANRHHHWFLYSLYHIP